MVRGASDSPAVDNAVGREAGHTFTAVVSTFRRIANANMQVLRRDLRSTYCYMAGHSHSPAPWEETAGSAYRTWLGSRARMLVTVLARLPGHQLACNEAGPMSPGEGGRMRERKRRS